MATVLSDIVLMFGSYISLLSSLLVVSGVSVLSVLVAVTLFRLVVNLIKPAFKVGSGVSENVGEKIFFKKEDRERARIDSGEYL